MELVQTGLPGVVVIKTTTFSDERGAFVRCYCERELQPVIGERRITQINHSKTLRPSAARGMHFQRGAAAEMRIVRCLRGRVWDVVVDLRAGSPTFLRWHGEELSPANQHMLVVPEGFAHGFQALDADSEMLYLHTGFYSQEDESGVSMLDPAPGISWPLPMVDLSARDRSFTPIDPGFAGLKT